MVEEYNLGTGVLNKRAWKSNSSIRKDSDWEIEVGDPLTEIHEDSFQNIGIKESQDSVSNLILSSGESCIVCQELWTIVLSVCLQPVVIHRVTRNKLEWRIRNIPYPIEYYNITVDPSEKCIVVRTTNKKFFKKLPMLDFQRLNLTPTQSALKYSHYMNTLVLSVRIRVL